MDYYQCRICLRSVYSGHLMGLFDPTFSTILKRFELLIGQEIQQSHLLPNQICELCIREINEVFTSIDNWARIQSSIYGYQLTQTVPTFVPVIYTNSQNNGGPPNAVVQPQFSDSEVLQQNLVPSNNTTANAGNWQQGNTLSSNEFQRCPSDRKSNINNFGHYNHSNYSCDLQNNLPPELSSPSPNEACFDFDIEQAEAIITEILGVSNKDSIAMKAPLCLESPATVDALRHVKSDIIDTSISVNTKEPVSNNATDNISQQSINFADTNNSNCAPQNAYFVAPNNTKNDCSYLKVNKEPLNNVHVKPLEDYLSPATHAAYGNILDMEGENSFNNTHANSVASCMKVPFGEMANVSCHLTTTKANEMNSQEKEGSDLSLSTNNSNSAHLNIEVKKVVSRTETLLEMQKITEVSNIATIFSVQNKPMKALKANENKIFENVTAPKHSMGKLYEEKVSEQYSVKPNTNGKLLTEDFMLDVDRSSKENTTAFSTIPKIPTINSSTDIYKKVTKTNEKTICASLTSNAYKKIILTNNTFDNENFECVSLPFYSYKKLTAKNLIINDAPTHANDICESKDNQLHKVCRHNDNNCLTKDYCEKLNVGDKVINFDVNPSIDRRINQSKCNDNNKNNVMSSNNIKMCSLKTKSNILKKICARGTCATTELVTLDNFKDTNILKEGVKTFSSPLENIDRSNTLTTPPPLVPCQHTATKKRKLVADKPIKIGSLSNLSQESTRSSNVNYFKLAKAKKGIINMTPINISDVSEYPIACDKQNEIHSDQTLIATLFSDEFSEQLNDKNDKPIATNLFEYIGSPNNDKVGETKCTLNDVRDNENIVHTGLKIYNLSDPKPNQTKQKEDKSQAMSPTNKIEVIDIDVDEQQPTNFLTTELEYKNICHAAPQRSIRTTERRNLPQKNKPSTTNFSTHRCCYCPREFPSKRSKAVHERSHKKALLCCYCGLNHPKGYGCSWNTNKQ